MTMKTQALVLLAGLLLSLPVTARTPADEVPLLMPGTRFPFKLWETEQLAAGLYAFRHSFYRTIFLVTDDGVIVADPLNDEAAAVMRKEISAITDQPVKYVAYSHSHWDHASGGQIFKAEGAQVVAQAGCAANMRENPHPNVVPPDVTFDDYHQISLGDHSLEMFYFGPSHDNCLAVIVANPANMLFLVDVSNPPDGWAMFYNPALSEERPWHMVKFLTRVTELIDERGIETIIGGHMGGSFDPVTNRPTIVKATSAPATIVRDRLAFWTAIIELPRAELAAGTPPEEVPDRIVEKGLLADRISGYDPKKMHILMRRLTSLAITGE
ncbi:MAG: MBL fold metallo-hydrolase [Gammaproteobacteria bacterium]|nr:MBL fold metallo-hydrolase [Gammaproteobacteria bacterium]